MTQSPPQERSTPKPTPAKSSRAGPIVAGVVAIVLIVAIAGVVGVAMLTGVFRVRHDTTTIIRSIVTDVRAESKLVVLTTTTTVYLSQSDKKYVWWVYLGTTSVRMRVDHCKVQYYVPLSQFASSDMQLSPDRKTLDVTLPAPVLDDHFVDVPTDPQYYWVEKSSGWGRFDKNLMEEHLREGLRSAVIEQARETPLDDDLQLAAKQKIVDFFTKTCRGLQLGEINVRVKFHNKA